ncbi:cytochrome c oxidase subunit 6C-1 isoform X1 [Ixodes scapularis]|nr:cytochrome c oxidase subunit 6C-1 isoform X1 [Ixodes scapularis]XP_029828871.1 cytochrome c oxidase subunit 6C-1 isoform X1 [Ixodes scapularis]
MSIHRSGQQATTMALARPQFHGLLKSYIRKHLIICLSLAGVGGVAWHYGVCEARKKAYADFYKTYDAAADNERMTKLGLFQSNPGPGH